MGRLYLINPNNPLVSLVIVANEFPTDGRHYTPGFPTAHDKNFSWPSIPKEIDRCDGQFDSLWGILRRVAEGFLRRRLSGSSLVSNLSYCNNAPLTPESDAKLGLLHGNPSARSCRQGKKDSYAT